MEAVKMFEPLNEKEMQSLYLAVSCGCVKLIMQLVNEKSHSRRMRKLQDCHDVTLSDMIRRLDPVLARRIELFNLYTEGANTLLTEIAEDAPSNIHVLLNLAFYCYRQLPVRDKHYQRLVALFDLFDGVWKNKENTKSGERIFERIDEQVHILVAQRGGIAP